MTPPLAVRLLAYEPNGGPVGPLPYPLDLSASMPLSDWGALQLTYSTLVPGGDLIARGLATGLEIALQVDYGTGWVEPDNARYLLMRRSNNDADDTDTRRVTCRGYAWQLTKVLHLNPGAINADGVRKFQINIKPGAVMKTLLDEAHSTGRNAVPGLTYDFTATHDSAGQAWDSNVAFDLELGVDLFTVLNSLVGQGVVEWTMQGRTLRMFNPGTTLARNRWYQDRVAIVVDRDVAEAPVSETIEGLASAVLVRGDGDVFAISTSGTAPQPWGRWEATVDRRDLSSASEASSAGTAHLSRVGRVRAEHTRALVFESARWLPVRDYLPGDYVGAPDVPLRVHQLTLTRDGDGRVGGNVVLGDRFVSAEIREARQQLEMRAWRTARRRTGATAPKPQPPTFTGRTGITRIGTLTGRNVSKVRLTWAQVTANTDGAPLRVAKYEVMARRAASDPWIQVGAVDGDTTTFDHDLLEPGDSYSYGLVAVTDYGERSDLVEIGDGFQPVPVDTTPPPVPTAPLLSSSLGQVTVTWDGSLLDAIPADFARVEVALGDTSTPTALVGSLVTGGVLTVPGTPGDTVWVRLRSVDEVGNPSAWSPAIDAVVASPAADPSIADAFMDLEGAVEGAVTSANGKNRVTYGTAAPTDPTWTVDRTNLATNPRPSGSTTGWLFQQSGGAVASVTLQGGAGPTGMPGYRSAVLTTGETSAGANGHYVRFPVTGAAGDTFTASMYYRTDVTGVPIRIVATPRRAGTALGGATFTDYETPPPSTWVRLSITLPVAETIDEIQVWVHDGGTYPTNAVIHGSSVLIERGDTLEPYFDGDTPASPGVRYAWTGTAHASTSQRLVSPGAPTDGDTHFVFTGSNITGHWTFNGTTGVWEQKALGHQVIASVDLGKATVGELDGGRVKAGTIGTPQLRVGAFNLIADPLFQVSAIRTARAEQLGVGFSQGLEAKDGHWSATVTSASSSSRTFYTHADPADLYSLPVVPGEKYRLGVWVRAFTSPGPAWRFVVRTKTASGTTGFATPAGSSFQATSGSWTYYETEYVPSASIVAVQPGFQIDADGLNPGSIAGFSQPTFQQKYAGSLIVDGSIAAKHLAAEIVLASTSIIAGTPGGARTELTPTGLRKYASNGTTVLFDLAGSSAIFRGSIEGATVTGTTVTGGTVRTASSGIRVEITGSDQGAIRFYRSNGTIAGKIGMNGASLVVGDFNDYATNLELRGDSVSLHSALGDTYLFNGAGFTLAAQGVYNVTTTAGVNVHVTSSGRLVRSTSAARYKLDAQPLPDTDAEKILDLAVQTWIDKGEAEARDAAMATGRAAAPAPLRRIPGLVAEQVAAAGLDEFVVYGDDGQVEGLMYDRLALALIPVVRRLRDEVAVLKGGGTDLPTLPGKGTTR